MPSHAIGMIKSCLQRKISAYLWFRYADRASPSGHSHFSRPSELGNPQPVEWNVKLEHCGASKREEIQTQAANYDAKRRRCRSASPGPCNPIKSAVDCSPAPSSALGRAELSFTQLS